MGYSEIARHSDTGKRTYRFDTRIDGKRHQKRVKCWPSEVKALFRSWEMGLEASAKRAREPMLFENLDRFLDHVKETRSAQTSGHYKTVVESLIKQFFHDMPLREIRRKHIEEFLKWRRTQCLWTTRKKPERVSASTLNHSLNVLSSFFNWAIVQEHLEANPCFKLRTRENNYREIRLTMDQIRELLDKTAAYDRRLNRLIQIALGTGLRFGEIMNLTWDEVDFERNIVFLSRQKTKSKRARVVPLIGPIRDLFLEMMRESGTRERVFASSYQALQLSWKRFRPALSFETAHDGPLRLHDLRHCCAQFLLDRGVPMEDIQVVLGHQDLTTTQRRYAPLARPDLAEKMERLTDLIPFRRADGEDLVN